MRAMKQTSGKVYLIGAGPGDPELLTIKAARVLRTRSAKAMLGAGARTTLRLKLSKATRRSIRRSLDRRGRRATVRIAVRAADPAGNARSATRHVRIVR